MKSRILLTAASAAAAALVLAGCAGGSDEPAPSGDTGGEASGAFPVTISSALGEATIDAQPERIATWGWGSTDTVLALGITPVAIPADNYSGGDDLIAPWVSDALDELGGEEPAILGAGTGELSVEELLATDPDVLVAPYSGLTQEEYDAVTGAGVPVVAYPTVPWETPWRDIVTITGEAVGMAEEAEGLVADMEQQLSDAAAENPEFADLTVAFVGPSGGAYYAYTPADPRVEILEELGFTTAPGVAALDPGDGTFYIDISPETLDGIDADVVVTQAETDEALEEFIASDSARLMPAVSNGAVAGVVGAENSSALTPTPLALPFILPTLVEELSAAASNVP